MQSLFCPGAWKYLKPQQPQIWRGGGNKKEKDSNKPTPHTFRLDKAFKTRLDQLKQNTAPQQLRRDVCHGTAVCDSPLYLRCTEESISFAFKEQTNGEQPALCFLPEFG